MHNESHYVPFGERPEPYPDGYRPNPTRWTGRELVRVKEGTNDDENCPAELSGLQATAADPRAITARTSTRMRYFPSERLPAKRLVIAEHITDDPGALALHGRRIQNGDVTTPGADDPWIATEGALHEIPVGAVLVSVETECDGRKQWRAWRVAPVGVPVMVLHETATRGQRDHLKRLTALLDEDLRDAFANILTRYERSDARPEHIAHMRRTIEVWRFEAETTLQPRRQRRQRLPAAAPPATGTRPRLLASV